MLANAICRLPCTQKYFILVGMTSDSSDSILMVKISRRLLLWLVSDTHHDREMSDQEGPWTSYPDENRCDLCRISVYSHPCPPFGGLLGYQWISTVRLTNTDSDLSRKIPSRIYFPITPALGRYFIECNNARQLPWDLEMSMLVLGRRLDGSSICVCPSLRRILITFMGRKQIDIYRHRHLQEVARQWKTRGRLHKTYGPRVF